MKKLISICFILCVISSAAAQQSPTQKVLHVYDWKDLMSQHHFPDSQIVSIDGISVLKVEKTNNTPLELTLLTITNSALLKNAKSIVFDVKYENLQQLIILFTNRFYFGSQAKYMYQHAFPQLEIPTGVIIRYEPFAGSNCNFPPPRVSSGKITMGLHYPPEVQGGDETTNDETQYILGTSNWKREDYAIMPSGEILPTQLELKLYLPGPGTIYLRPIKLLGVEQDWWSPQIMGMVGGALIGGVGGTLIGLCGALIGCLVGMGKARRFVLALTKALIALGIVLTIVGIVAATSKQSWALWYPLVLLGGITTLVCSVNLYPIKRRYDELEIRRMTSMDATGR